MVYVVGYGVLVMFLGGYFVEMIIVSFSVVVFCEFFLFLKQFIKCQDNGCCGINDNVIVDYNMLFYVGVLVIIFVVFGLVCVLFMIVFKFFIICIFECFFFVVCYFGIGVLFVIVFVYFFLMVFIFFGDLCFFSFWIDDYFVMLGVIVLFGIFFVVVIEMVFSFVCQYIFCFGR